MKKGYVREQLSADNEAAVRHELDEDNGLQEYAGLILLLAQVLDNAAKGEDIYCTLGSTKSKDAFVLTVIWDGARTYASGGNLLAVSQVAESLVED